MRINKYIAHSGFCSRRKAEDYIKQGRVRLNGDVTRELSTQVKEDDIVTIDNKTLEIVEKKYYLAFNKPVGVISSNEDLHNPDNIFNYIDIDSKLFSIGRLDKDSEGLILITNDGDLYNRLMHPSKKVKKYYTVTLDKKISNRDIEEIASGVDIGGYVTKKSIINLLTNTNNPTLDVIITEGKNRQIRKMFESKGYKVINLKRYQIANIKLGELKSGRYRHLNDVELRKLKEYE